MVNPTSDIAHSGTGIDHPVSHESIHRTLSIAVPRCAAPRADPRPAHPPGHPPPKDRPPARRAWWAARHPGHLAFRVSSSARIRSSSCPTAGGIDSGSWCVRRRRSGARRFRGRVARRPRRRHTESGTVGGDACPNVRDWRRYRLLPRTGLPQPVWAPPVSGRSDPNALDQSSTATAEWPLPVPARRPSRSRSTWCRPPSRSSRPRPPAPARPRPG